MDDWAQAGLWPGSDIHGDFDGMHHVSIGEPSLDIALKYLSLAW